MKWEFCELNKHGLRNKDTRSLFVCVINGTRRSLLQNQSSKMAPEPTAILEVAFMLSLRNDTES